MSAKEILSGVAKKPPPDAILADAIYELELLQDVKEMLAKLDCGKGIPLGQIKTNIGSWAGK